MGIESKPPVDILRINALVDGELSPHDRAEIATKIAGDRDLARAHATLARLKACVAESAEVTPDVSLILPARRRPRLPLALGAGLAAAGALMFFIYSAAPDRKQVPTAARDAVITLAALPNNPVVPDLDVAGLRLTNIDVDRSGPTRSLIATYSGTHGCRLDLRVRPTGAAAPAMGGTSFHAWSVGELAYELAAHGMPGWRFSLIAEAAERETRGGSLPENARHLREARAGAPPCAG